MGNMYLHQITARKPSSLAARHLPQFISPDVSIGPGCINRVLRATSRLATQSTSKRTDRASAMRRIATTVVLIGLAGCASQAKFQAKMDRFVGQSEAVVVGTYGPPQNSYVVKDGSKVLQYTRGGTVMMPGATTYQPVTTNTSGNVTLNQGVRTTTGVYNQTSTTYVQQQAPGIPINLSCTVNFTVDKDGVVRRWNAEGNHCVSN